METATLAVVEEAAEAEAVAVGDMEAAMEGMEDQEDLGDLEIVPLEMVAAEPED